MTFLFDNEPLLMVTGWNLIPGFPHAAYQLLCLAEIRLIRETDKPIIVPKAEYYSYLQVVKLIN